MQFYNTDSMDLEEADELTISGPITLQTYKAIADYKALDKGEVSFKEDEIVDIVEKNDNGKCKLSFTLSPPPPPPLSMEDLPI